jgi:hypothetical protein
VRITIVRRVRYEGGWRNDPSNVVAEVEIDQKSKTAEVVAVFNQSYETTLQRVFAGGVVRFTGGFRGPDGVSADSVTRYLPGEEGYLEALEEELRGSTLGMIVQYQPPSNSEQGGRRKLSWLARWLHHPSRA